MRKFMVNNTNYKNLKMHMYYMGLYICFSQLTFFCRYDYIIFTGAPEFSGAQFY